MIGWNDAEVDQEIVDFAVSQFSGIGKVYCYNVEVENFQYQVSSIIPYVLSKVLWLISSFVITCTKTR